MKPHTVKEGTIDRLNKEKNEKKKKNKRMRDFILLENASRQKDEGQNVSEKTWKKEGDETINRVSMEGRIMEQKWRQKYQRMPMLQNKIV